MTPGLFVCVALAGGLGSASRLFVDGAIRSRLGAAMPWGTALINISGSFLLGLIAGLSTARLLPEPAHLVVGAGFLGGYTTFSTASFETVRLLQERKWVAGALGSLGVLVSATALAGLGLWIGQTR